MLNGAPGLAGVVAAAAAAARAIRSTVRSATTTRCSRAAAAPARSTGRGGGPNAETGAKVFQDFCASCHKFQSVGNAYGPELTTIGSQPRRDILRSIFFPQEKIDPKYETTVSRLRDNKTVRGLVVSEDATNVRLKTADNADLVTVAKADILKRTRERASIMPEQLIDKMGGDANISHVVAYLMGGK